MITKDKVLPLSLPVKWHAFFKKPNRAMALSQVVALVMVNECVKFMKQNKACFQKIHVIALHTKNMMI